MRELLEWGDNKAMAITLEELQASIGVRNNRGEYNRRLPMKHSDFIETIINNVEQSYDVTPGEIYVPKNRIGVVHEMDPERLGLIKASMFRSMIGVLHLNSLKTDEMNMSIAYNITDKGVTLAMGTNIAICSNMTIMGASNVITTNGRKGLPFDKFMELFHGWLPRIDETWNKYIDVIEEMKTIQLAGNGQIQELIGDLQIAATRRAYEKGYYDAPINLAELSKLTQGLIKKPEFLQEEPMTLWEIFNDFTEVSTHSEYNIDTKIEDHLKISDFLLRKYAPQTDKLFLN